MRKHYFTSEAVTEGHPDKLCDQVADAILDALVEIDPLSRVACEVTAEKGAMHIMGEITTNAKIDYIEKAREVIRKIGYTDDSLGFSDQSDITCKLDKQSADIAMGVDNSLESKEGLEELENGAGDQGMMFGYACDETEELMPLSITLAQKLVMQLTKVRKEGVLSYLRPDGKSQVTVQYENGRPARIDAVVLSTQHDENIDMNILRKDIRQYVIDPIIPTEMRDDQTKYYINPTGRFVIGGPAGDTGLTGRKIIVDTYGGVARHGGGAFSGKDATKVDRSGAYMARYAAKNVVAAGLAKSCEVQLSYAIGVAQPLSIYVDTFNTGIISDERIEQLLRDNFDFRPTAIINQFGLHRPIFSDVSIYGHFGRKDLDLPWEKCDKAEQLKQQANI